MRNQYQIKCDLMTAVLYGDKILNVAGLSRDSCLAKNTVKKHLPEIQEILKEAYHFWRVHKDIKSREEAIYENYAYHLLMDKKELAIKEYIKNAKQEAKAGKYNMEGK
jgi:hypothetical protein